MKLALSAIIFAALVALNPVAALAAPPLGEQAASLGDALEKANAYSMSTGGIAIIISYGTGNDGTPDRIGNAFVQEIEKRGRKARFFYHDATWPGVSMSYRIGHSSLGPWSVDAAASHIGDAVRRAEAAQKISEE